MERPITPKVIMSYEYTVTVPEKERASFRLIAKKMGWSVKGPKRLSAYERSKLEAKNGQVECFDSVESMFAALNS